MQFLADMLANKPAYWLTFLGTSGAGKTMLTRMISSAFRRQLDGTIASESSERIVRRRGGFIRWSNLANSLRNQEYGKFDDICADWFVALDDVGSEVVTPFTTEKLFDFCCRRERKWTVLTGNWHLDELGAKLDVRIASRLIRHGNQVVDVEMPDFNSR